MARFRFSCSVLAALLVCMALAPLPSQAWDGTAQVLYSFSGETDGGYPASDLVTDAAGNIYGTSVEGGTFGSGAVFQLAPSAGGWTQTVLYSFTSGADGGQPYGGVTLDSQGNLYGTAVVGGNGRACEDGCGVVYKLTKSGSAWSQSVLYSFTGGSDGSGPGAGLTLDRNGNVYGMTPTGGQYGLGVIYQLQPRLNGTWKFNLIHAFTGGVDGGAGSAGRLLLDKSGNLFGVATVGGASGKGAVFELTLGSDNRWRLKTLYSFKGQPDAGFPYGGLLFDAAGNLYGTTYYDGANNLGSVYKLSMKNGVWNETVLYSFKGGTDGLGPISNLVLDAHGNLLGTTSEGGAGGCSCGTIFRLAQSSNGQWRESVAYSFTGHPDAAFAYNGMVSGPSGTYYGTTVHGGVDNEGAVYQFTP